MIPKIIHQSWKTKDLSSFKGKRIYVHKFVKKIKQHYPDAEYMFWDDNDIENLIMEDDSFHFIRDAWQQSTNIMKSDISRYAMVYKHGGVWMDLDINSQKPLSDLFDNEWDFVGYKAKRNATRWVTGNAFFGAAAGSHLLDSMLWNISTNEDILTGKIKNKKDKAWKNYLPSVLESTGPDALHDTYLNLVERNRLRDRVHHYCISKVANWPEYLGHRGRWQNPPKFLRHERACSWARKGAK